MATADRPAYRIAWQLVAGGVLLVPVALIVEGAPPALDASAVGAYGYLGLVGSMLAQRLAALQHRARSRADACVAA